MAKIERLPDDVVRRIAAGEVIERPASVVKELVENSLDAGASNIRVEATDGGIRRIRVTDDGCGIEKDDLPLAVAPHATSKIKSDADLLAIKTLGFRGEALAAIGRVSYLRIESRADGASCGWAITVRGGNPSSPVPSSHPKGTTVTVEQLFFNLPARRRFLRQPSTEAAKIASTLTTIALANPDIAFTLLLDGRTYIRVPAADSYLVRAQQLFPNAQETSVLLEGRASHEGIAAYILVSPPFLSRRDTRMQFFFVNKRPVRDETIRKALRDAFADKLPSGRNPVAFLFLSVPPELVDVNVHPAKQEVRFRKPGSVYTAIRRAADNALSAAQHLSSTTPTAPAQENIRQAIADFLSSRRTNATPQKQLTLTPPKKSAQRPAERTVPAGRFFVLHNTFIVVETDDGFALIDQHALHERLIYDSLRAEVACRKLTSQKLLVPLRLNVTAEEETVFEQNRALFKQLGFVMEVDKRALVVSAAPSILSEEAEIEEAVKEILAGFLEEVGGGMGDKMDMALKSVACKAAVKAGEALSEKDVSWLLSEAKRCATPITCPHGRPLARFFSLEEVARWFKR